MTARQKVTVLGATGSVGLSTLEILRAHQDKYKVVALSANEQMEKLAALALEFKPDIIAIGNRDKESALKKSVAGTGIEVVSGSEGLLEVARRQTDFVMAAIVGAAGLAPTYEAIKQGVRLGLANKECLVSAGDLLITAAREFGSIILPVDSEHNAIYQVFDFKQKDSVEKIILTASGGPFRGKLAVDLQSVTPSQAVAHPNWDMGAKISVDSATLMNKGLEIIEAYYLFPVREDQIDVIVHPQSVIHSMVEYKDGSILCQMGPPDMKVPISYCLGWPERLEVEFPRFSFSDTSRFTFEKPDTNTFKCLKLARDALKAGGAASLVLNAANEICVEAFLAGRIGFLEIGNLVEEALSLHSDMKVPQSIASVLEADLHVRQNVTQLLQRRMV